MEIKDLPNKTLLTPEEVAKFFSISKKTVYRWCEEGSLQYCKPNGILRIFRHSVIALLNEKQPITEPTTEGPTPKIEISRHRSGWVKKW